MARGKNNSNQAAAGGPPATAPEYPETVMFPPRAPLAAAAADDWYTDTVMFPPRAPLAAAAADDWYTDTVMFPPRAPLAAAAATEDEAYPETVAYPPRAPQAADSGYPEAAMFPPRGPPAKGWPAAAAAPVSSYPPAPGFPRPPTQPPPFHVQAPQPGPPQPQVIAGTPIQQTPQFVQGNPWSTGLFDCSEDPTSAVMTYLFPCITFGQIAEILDQGQTSCFLAASIYALLMPYLSPFVGAPYRRRLRQMYNLVQAPAEDCILHLFCPCCALSQEYRELKNRGYDPSLGWMGNLAMQQAVTPPRMNPMQR